MLALGFAATGGWLAYSHERDSCLAQAAAIAEARETARADGDWLSSSLPDELLVTADMPPCYDPIPRAWIVFGRALLLSVIPWGFYYVVRWIIRGSLPAAITMSSSMLRSQANVPGGKPLQAVKDDPGEKDREMMWFAMAEAIIGSGSYALRDDERGQVHVLVRWLREGAGRGYDWQGAYRRIYASWASSRPLLPSPTEIDSLVMQQRPLPSMKPDLIDLISPDTVREHYQRVSDDELIDLTRQGQTQYTEVAWALMQEEVTRRGLTGVAPAVKEQPVRGLWFLAYIAPWMMVKVDAHATAPPLPEDSHSGQVTTGIEQWEKHLNTRLMIFAGITVVGLALTVWRMASGHIEEAVFALGIGIYFWYNVLLKKVRMRQPKKERE